MTSCNPQAQNNGEEHSIGRLVYLTSLKLRNYAEKILSPHDLTVEQFHLLKNTSRVSGLSQNELCQSVDKKPANITRILDRLEKKKWVERRMHPNDRRATLVFLTREGELMVKKVSNTFESYSSRFIAGVEDDEERIFRQVIEKINGNIDRLMNEITG